MTEPMRTRRHTCQHCGSAHARFCYRGRWKARSDHDLCPRCFRSLMDQMRAKRLARVA